MNIKSNKGTFKGFALVRDKDGNPRLDNFKGKVLPKELFEMLTKEEQDKYINPLTNEVI